MNKKGKKKKKYKKEEEDDDNDDEGETNIYRVIIINATLKIKKHIIINFKKI